MVRISCEPPAKERLLWSQGSNLKNLIALPRSRIISDVRTHFVLLNTNHFVRLVLLDKNGFSLLDHASIVSEIFSSNATLATVTKDVNSTDKAYVKFGKNTGTVFIKSSSKGYNFKEEHKSLFGSKSVEK